MAKFPLIEDNKYPPLYYELCTKLGNIGKYFTSCAQLSKSSDFLTVGNFSPIVCSLKNLPFDLLISNDLMYLPKVIIDPDPL